MGWESVSNYVPETGNDFGIIKANALECTVQYARVELYKGQKAELQGVPFFKYELSIVGGGAGLYWNFIFWSSGAVFTECPISLV